MNLIEYSSYDNIEVLTIFRSVGKLLIQAKQCNDDNCNYDDNNKYDDNYDDNSNNTNDNDNINDNNNNNNHINDSNNNNYYNNYCDDNYHKDNNDDKNDNNSLSNGILSFLYKNVLWNYYVIIVVDLGYSLLFLFLLIYRLKLFALKIHY